MKKAIAVIISCALSIAALPACDVVDSMKLPPVPTPSPTPMPVAFQDPEVEKTIRASLGEQEGVVTAADMLQVTSFEYNINRSAKGAISTISDLSWCKNLETLTVFEQKGLTSIESLRGLDKLRNVDIFGCGVSDLSPLAGDNALREIRISDCPVKDASPVLSLPNLESFNAFFGTEISDISALSGTHNLTFFSSQIKFHDYSPLLGHKDLKDVTLSGITDSFFRELLANCKNLRSVRIMNSDINDESLALLKGFSLYALTLDNCGIEDISALASLTTVQDLQIIDNYVSDIAPLGKLTKLSVSLDIQHNRIQDLSPLENLKNLKNLSVTGNPYTDASVLDQLEKGGCKVYR